MSIIGHMSPAEVQRHALLRVTRRFTDNLRKLEEALQENDLGNLAHDLTDGASVSEERNGKVVGRAIAAASSELVMMLAELDGMRTQEIHDAREADLLDRRRTSQRIQVLPNGAESEDGR